MTKAESLIAALDNLPLGEPFAAPFAEAESALAAELAAVDAEVFEIEHRPLSRDTIEQFRDLCNRAAAAGYRQTMTGHATRSVKSHPKLFSCFCSQECLADIAAAAARTAAPQDMTESHEDAQARAASAEVALYKRDICRLLAAIDGHPHQAAARRYLALGLAAESLAGRLAAAKAKLEEHARAELAHVQAERRAAARAIVDKTVERVREAEAAAADQRAKANAAEHEYRQVRAAALGERLRASGLRVLRVGSGDGERLFDVDDLVRTAGGMSLQQLSAYEAALAQHEASR